MRTREKSPSWHRKLRAKRAKARRFLKSLRGATYLPKGQQRRALRAGRLLLAHHSHPMGGWAQGKGKQSSWPGWGTWPHPKKQKEKKEGKGKGAGAESKEPEFPTYESLRSTTSSSSASSAGKTDQWKQGILDFLQSKSLRSTTSSSSASSAGKTDQWKQGILDFLQSKDYRARRTVEGTPGGWSFGRHQIRAENAQYKEEASGQTRQAQSQGDGEEGSLASFPSEVPRASPQARRDLQGRCQSAGTGDHGDSGRFEQDHCQGARFHGRFIERRQDGYNRVEASVSRFACANSISATEDGILCYGGSSPAQGISVQRQVTSSQQVSPNHFAGWGKEVSTEQKRQG